MKLYQSVAALIVDSVGIRFAKQQGPAGAVPHWALPGVELMEGELLHEALARGVLEETGLQVETLGRLVYVVQLHSPEEGLMATTHFVQVVK